MRKLSLLLLLLPLTGFAQDGADWPQWRGPARDGVVEKFQAPAAWPEALEQAWRIEVGEGHSSPLLHEGRIYLHARQGGREILRAIDFESGEVLWKAEVEVPYDMHPSALDHGKGPKSTPVIADNRIYTFGITGLLSCHLLENGELCWRRDFSRDFKTTSPLFGTALSPAVDQGRLIAHVGGHDDGSLSAFDTQTGATLWSWKGDGPAYASPLVLEINGVRQVVTQTQDHIVGLDAGKGEELWKLPFSTNYYQNSVTPVVYRDLIIFSGLDQGIMALRINRNGDSGQWQAETAWSNSRVSLYMNTPVIVGDKMYGLSHKRRGQFFCLDPASGEMLWGTRGREGENAAILASSELLFLLTTESRLAVAAATPEEYRQVAEYQVADTPIWAHPLVSGRSVVVKDLQHLTRWVIPQPSTPADNSGEIQKPRD